MNEQSDNTFDIVADIKQKRNILNKVKEGKRLIPDLSQHEVQLFISEMKEIDKSERNSFIAWIVDNEPEEKLYEGNYTMILSSFKEILTEIAEEDLLLYI